MMQRTNAQVLDDLALHVRRARVHRVGMNHSKTPVVRDEETKLYVAAVDRVLDDAAELINRGVFAEIKPLLEAETVGRP